MFKLNSLNCEYNRCSNDNVVKLMCIQLQIALKRHRLNKDTALFVQFVLIRKT